MHQRRLGLEATLEGPDLPPANFPDLARVEAVQLDCETDGTNWRQRHRPIGWALGLPDDTDRYFAFGHAAGNNCSREQWRAWARRELRGKRIENHSTKFDLHMSRVDGVDLVEQGCTFHDVAHDAALLNDHRKDFALDALALDELGEMKVDIGRKDDLASLPAGIVGAYACQDTKLVRKLKAHYDPKILAEGLTRVRALEDAVLPVVVEMERNGMPLDLALLERWEKMTGRILEKLRWELSREAGFAVNVDSPKDLTRLARVCGITDGELTRTESGAPSFTAQVMLGFADRAPAMLLAYRIGKLVDLRNKYLVKYAQEHVDGVLYANLWQLMTDEGGTVSGRFSCTRPNMQQVMGADKHRRAYGWMHEMALRYCDDVRPTDDFLVKRLFIPSRGGTWLSADAKQIEYRLFAHYTRSERILKRYRENPDVDFHNIVQDDIIRPFRADTTRTEVKVVNFLSIFGGKAGAVARNLGIEMSEAQALYDIYHASFPEAGALLREAEHAATQRGYVRSLFGRRSRFPMVKVEGKGGNTYWKRDRTHKACNAVIQPSAADLNKQKLVDIYLNRGKLGLTLRMTVHDSSENELADVGMTPEVRALFNEQVMPLSVPILWEVGAGDTWATAK